MRARENRHSGIFYAMTLFEVLQMLQQHYSNVTLAPMYLLGWISHLVDTPSGIF